MWEPACSITSASDMMVLVRSARSFFAKNDKGMAFGDRQNNNSIMTAKLYPAYSLGNRSFSNGSIVDRRNIVYYSCISAETTARMESELQVLTYVLPTGWNGVIAADPSADFSKYLAGICGCKTNIV